MAAVDLVVQGPVDFSATSSWTHLDNVAPSDSTDLAYVSRGFSFAVAGTLKVTALGGDVKTIPSGSLAAGIIHPGRVTRIWNTGTTATGIVVYW